MFKIGQSLYKQIFKKMLRSVICEVSIDLDQSLNDQRIPGDNKRKITEDLVSNMNQTNVNKLQQHYGVKKSLSCWDVSV